MDSNNPVVKLCTEGMQAEAQGRRSDARDLFLRAWGACADDFDACVAAHHVARHQSLPAETLRWNLTALSHAEEVGDDRVKGFYPSLYLNVGHSYEVLCNLDGARRYYDLATERLGDLPDGPYATVVRRGVAEGRRRIEALGL